MSQEVHLVGQVNFIECRRSWQSIDYIGNTPKVKHMTPHGWKFAPYGLQGYSAAGADNSSKLICKITFWQIYVCPCFNFSIFYTGESDILQAVVMDIYVTWSKEPLHTKRTANRSPSSPWTFGSFSSSNNSSISAATAMLTRSNCAFWSLKCK